MKATDRPSQLDRVIVALDYDEPYKAFQLVDELDELVDWYKIGPVLFTLSGLEVVKFLHRKGKKVFLDLKLHDTPNVVSDTVRQFGDLGAQFATVHCAGGSRMLAAAAKGCRGSQLKLLGVTLLTSLPATGSHPSADQSDGSDVVLQMIGPALEARLAGILCSPHEVQAARRHILPGFLLATPGIRLPGREVFGDDQVRVASPAEALAWGADYLIIGRPITQAREPREVVKGLFG